MKNSYNDIRVKSKEDWIRVLSAEEQIDDNIIFDIFKIVYDSYNHESNCGKIGEKLGKDKGAINLHIRAFGKRVIKLLDIPEVIGDGGEPRYWNIPFETIESKNSNKLFIWKLRPLLIEVLEEKYGYKEITNLDEGVKFVLNNCEKTLELVSNNEQFKDLKSLVIREYYYLKSIKYTGNMYEHFSKYKAGNHKYAEAFSFLEDYGIVSNEKMAEYLQLNYSDELDHYWSIDDLVVGNIYTNNEIASTFKCSNMGGMRRSKETNSLVLIAKHNNPIYDDQWTEEGILNYTGMGTENDQSIEFAQNKTLTIAKREGIKVYLFESYKDNEYYYSGEVELYGSPYQSEETDINGNMRKVVKFPLKRVDPSKTVIVDIKDIEKSEQEKIKEVRKNNVEEIKVRAKTAESNKVFTKEVKTTYRERNQYIAEYTKERAKGICDLCGEEAPFKDKSGRPYLESHHVITLADNGPDAIYNTVAICPNCHRKIHVLNKKEDMEKLAKVIMKYLLDDKDEQNIKKWEELFK